MSAVGRVSNDRRWQAVANTRTPDNTASAAENALDCNAAPRQPRFVVTARVFLRSSMALLCPLSRTEPCDTTTFRELLFLAWILSRIGKESVTGGIGRCSLDNQVTQLQLGTGRNLGRDPNGRESLARLRQVLPF